MRRWLTKALIDMLRDAAVGCLMIATVLASLRGLIG